MFCSKCGKPMSENDQFCQFCGAPAMKVPPETPAEPMPETTPTTAPEPAPGMPMPMAVKRKKSPLPWIIVGGVIVLAAALLLLFGQNIKELYYENIASPQTYFEHIHSSGVDEMVEAAASLGDLNEENKAVSNTLTLSLADAGKGYLKELTGGELDFVDSVSVQTGLTADDGKAAMPVDISLNGQSIAALKTFVNAADKEVFIGLPEYNPTYLKTKFKTADRQASSYIKSMPDRADAEKLYQRYLSLALAQIDDVTRNQGEMLTVGDVSVKCTTLTAVINKATVVRIAQAWVNEAKEDAELKEYVTDAFYTDLDKLLSAVEKIKDEFGVTYKCYIVHGKIVGADISSGEGNISIYAVKHGKDYAISGACGDPELIISFAGTMHLQDKKWNGTVTFKNGDKEYLTEEFTDFDDKTMKDGKPNGTVTLKAGKDLKNELGKTELGAFASLIDVYRLKIKIETDDKQSKIEAELLQGETQLASVTMQTDLTSAEKITLPTAAIDFSLDGKAAANGTDLTKWLSGFDTNKLTQNLKKADLPEKYVQAAEYGLSMIK